MLTFVSKVIFEKLTKSRLVHINGHLRNTCVSSLKLTNICASDKSVSKNIFESHESHCMNQSHVCRAGESQSLSANPMLDLILVDPVMSLALSSSVRPYWFISVKSTCSVSTLSSTWPLLIKLPLVYDTNLLVLAITSHNNQREGRTLF